MARVFIDSFETQDLSLWDTNSGSTIISTTGLAMKGSYCLEINGVSDYIIKYLPEKDEYYFAFRFRTTNIGNGKIFWLYHDGVELLKIWNSSPLTYVCASTYTAGSETIVINITYFIQIYFKVANSGGRLKSIVDNILDFDYTGDTQPGGDTTINRVRFGPRVWVDNIVIDDSTMPEETEISVLKPNGVGHYSDFVPTPSGNNYTCVDEIPYNDSDFVSSGIVNAIDTYTLEDMPNAKSVKCVQMQTRARKDSDSPLTKFNFVMRNNSTDYHGNDILLSNIFSSYSEMYLGGPTGSGIWRQSNVDSLEIGVRTRT